MATFGETGWCGGLAPFSGPKEGRKNRVIPEGKFLYFPRFISELEAELIKRREEKRQALKERIEGMVKERGISLAELFPQAGKIESQAKTKRNGAERKVKYRNPSDSSQTWKGTGRKPAWVIQALSSGKTLEDLTV